MQHYLAQHISNRHIVEKKHSKCAYTGVVDVVVSAAREQISCTLCVVHTTLTCFAHITKAFSLDTTLAICLLHTTLKLAFPARYATLTTIFRFPAHCLSLSYTKHSNEHITRNEFTRCQLHSFSTICAHIMNTVTTLQISTYTCYVS